MDGRKTDDEAIGRIGIGTDKDSNTLNSHVLPGENYMSDAREERTGFHQQRL
jgi:hypothetical protein